ncbi:hypothetical protein ACGFIW_01460 [Micromonospora sp. NPDC048935]|uniref:hypothetical protein n=1 Tax=Micromonospora sp. NPDC048935 TaxID=3364262 RepID=UPI0037178E7F
MSTKQPADLPEGSIVANNTIALFRVLSGIGVVWRGTDGRRYDDASVDELLSGGAVVLRDGFSA